MRRTYGAWHDVGLHPNVANAGNDAAKPGIDGTYGRGTGSAETRGVDAAEYEIDARSYDEQFHRAGIGFRV